jgi:ectoine hydroxylase-related dioxygenase (phytanoyl-CoA dioxygenase family)
MSYPQASAAQIGFFEQHGWLVVEDAIPQDDLDRLEAECDQVLSEKERVAADWAWDVKEDRDKRSFRIVQAMLGWVRPDVAILPHRRWLSAFGSALMNQKVDFWYDQFLGKPPGKSVPTYWHQDEGYWGRNLDDKGITCWIPLHDVDAANGCMHFIDRGHLDGVLTHRLVEGMASDLLTCDVDESRTVVCPIRRGSVTFHHSKTPHMTTANTSSRWRKAVTNHMQAVGAGGEGGHYPWKIYVNQRTGERLVPVRS